MSSKKYDSIIINVYFFEEGNFWNLSATGYIGDNDPENVEIDPNSLDPNLTEDEVKEEIKMMGEGFIDPINDGLPTQLTKQQTEAIERAEQRPPSRIKGKQLPSRKTLADAVYDVALDAAKEIVVKDAVDEINKTVNLSWGQRQEGLKKIVTRLMETQNGLQT